MADDDEYDDETGALLRELVAITQAQEELILTLVQVLALPNDHKGDATKALQNLNTRLQTLPGLTAHRLASKYRIARFLSDEAPDDEIHANRLDALEELLLKLDPDNLGDWQ